MDPSAFEAAQGRCTRTSPRPQIRPLQEISVRQILNPADPALRPFCEVYAAAFREPPYEEQFPAEWIEREVWRPQLPYLVLVAERAGEVVGLGCAHPLSVDGLSPSAQAFISEQVQLPFDPKSSIYISELAVRSDMRRMGIGCAITRATLAWAAGQGYENYALRTAAEGSNSLSLYQSLGALPFGPCQTVQTTEGGISDTQSQKRIYLWGKVADGIRNPNKPCLGESAMKPCPTLLSDTVLCREVHIEDCFPGGNDTYLVVGPRIGRDQYAEANGAMLKRFPYFEQGGFVEAPKSGSALARLQMAGGEFCGNAARSCAAVLANDLFGSKAYAPLFNYDSLEVNGNGLSFALEVSGTDQLISAAVRKGERGFWVEISMPVPQNRSGPQADILKLGGKVLPATVVALDGITHVLIQELDLEFAADPDKRRATVKEAIRQLGLEELPAVGLIWVSNLAGKYAIKPVVYVKAIDTCFYESACGSGSAALAIAATSRMGSQSALIQSALVQIAQPSEVTLEVAVSRTPEGALKRVTLAGPVTLRGNLLEREEVSRENA